MFRTNYDPTLENPCDPLSVSSLKCQESVQLSNLNKDKDKPKRNPLKECAQYIEAFNACRTAQEQGNALTEKVCRLEKQAAAAAAANQGYANINQRSGQQSNKFINCNTIAGNSDGSPVHVSMGDNNVLKVASGHSDMPFKFIQGEHSAPGTSMDTNLFVNTEQEDEK